MQHSSKPYEELEMAKSAIETLRQARSLEESEQCWKEFLYRIDRVWNKAEAHFSKSPKWSGWCGKYKKLRKEDELLCYIRHARNADEHSIEDITKRNPSIMTINGVDRSRPLHIERLHFGEHGEILEARANMPLDIRFTPARMTMLPVSNRGVQYNIPTQHKGAPIDPTDVIDAAEKTLVFYKNFLEEAEAFFVK